MHYLSAYIDDTVNLYPSCQSQFSSQKYPYLFFPLTYWHVETSMSEPIPLFLSRYWTLLYQWIAINNNLTIDGLTINLKLPLTVYSHV